ncbi:tyrosine-type recombinase/integrase [Aestuariibaculum sediminum]|uniref:Tyrosine-type recombinase/integrase n=1 Tax=Aestuariibaculum sediminum TaxID=2770637 RepID=A0A8J6QH39_9FLAO|nr:tyrosine-type recombinase/integrase [Aestuariibaculum sediminum]MBD0831654.1 tyrosine-type recombinase/integrase [Aestuariibaculum sediminum]
MSYLNEFLTFEHRSEHVFEHDLSKKPQFSTPKIYTANGNLDKRWYVYFSFRNPKTGKLERMKNIYGIANTYKKKEERLSVLTTYRKRLIILLKKGYNPFENNEALFKKEKAQAIKPKQIKTEVAPKVQPAHSSNEGKNQTSKFLEKPQPNSPTIKEAFDLSLNLKKNVISERTLKDYTFHANKFTDWLNESAPEIKTINQIDKAVVQTFLNHVLSNTSARSFNNHRTNLGALLQTMEDNDIIVTNPVKKIKVLKAKPERNKTYSQEQQTTIFNYLKKEDPILLLYIQFVAYNFLRPIEVCRLKIKDINVAEGLIQFKSKTNALEVKRIPDMLLEELPDLSGFDPESFLFTPDKLGDFWDTEENNKRNYFSKRFKKVVKEHFNIDDNYGLYSFRHTFITKLYQSLISQYPPNEVKSRIMQITGHSTMNALEKYLRSIDAAIPEDYSHLLK